MHLLSKFCRLCASYGSVFSGLMNLDLDNRTFLEKLNTLSPETVEINSELPNTICKDCIVQLNAAYNFINTCIKSQETLKKYLENLSCGKNIQESGSIKSEIIWIENTVVPDSELNEFSDECKIDVEENKINVIFDQNEPSFHNVTIKNESTNIEFPLENNTIIKVEENSQLDRSSEDYILPNNEVIEENIDKTSKVDSENSENLSILNDYICEICGKTFSDSLKLEQHFRAHRNANQCTICEKVFSNKSLLLVHIRSHTREKPYKCHICNRAFAQNGNLKTHIATHSKEKPFKCELCGKTFARNTTLKIHIRTHSNERPYNCGDCNNSFVNSGSLRRHTRIHLNERPYKCRVCEKDFQSKSDLTRHYQTHANDRIYKCGLCDKIFSQINHLKSHVRMHENNK